jgi:hypothetical protein
MSNQWVRASKNVPHVFGGNVNSTLKTWLDELGIKDFVHAELEVHSIDPHAMELSALHFTKTYIEYDCIFTVGKIADRILTLAGLDHGALPTTNASKQEINESLAKCRNYLVRRMFHAPTSSTNLSS